MSLWARVVARQRPPDPPDPPGQAASPSPVDLLLGSPLFDVAWYAETAGCETRPRAAARHYLRSGRQRGLHPHPLFVPDVAVSSCPALAEAADPLLGYLEGGAFDAVTHPLFDVAWYVGRHPESRRHRWGPLGHYVLEGCRLGLAPNDWYRPRADQPRGLVDWVVEQQREWAGRRQARPRARTRRAPPEPSSEPPLPARSLVGVVVEALDDAPALVRTVRSVLAQELPAAGVVVATDHAEAATRQALDAAFGAGAVAVVAAVGRPAAALNAAASRVAGSHLAFVQSGETWPPKRLLRMQHAAVDGHETVVADTLRLQRSGGPDGYAAARRPSGTPRPAVAIETSRLLVSRHAFERVCGFDESLAGGWEADLSCRLVLRHRVRWLDVLGATRDLPPATQPDDRSARPDGPDTPDGPGRAERAPAWTVSALHRHAVDWAALATRTPRPDVVSVIVMGTDWRHVRGCVARLHTTGSPPGRSVECLVVDDGSDALTSQVMSSLELRFPSVRVLRPSGTVGGAPAQALVDGLVGARGSVVVLLGCDVRVQPGWLEPLLAGLERPEVLGVQALVTDPSGAVHSAGFAFPDTGGPPYDFLQGFPPDDAAGLASVPFSAVSGSALAVRFADLVTARGLDPLFRSGLADADLCLRLAGSRAGHFLVAPRSRVTQQRPRRNRSSAVSRLDRTLFAARWAGQEPRDDTRLWAGCGFQKVGFDQQTSQPLLRRPAVHVDEPAPRLRWALKVASPAGDRRELWGDTHFAQSLARALRALDQHVVVDHREGFHRPTSCHDDVTLVLRGLEAFRPDPAQLSLAWVISHPELVTAQEAAGFDQVFAASRSWAAETSRRWGIDVEPLLQATDPELFHPDRGRPDAGEPVLFVGGSRREYRRMVRDSIASGVPVSVFGSGWEDLIPAPHLKGTFVPNRDVGALYASAGVVLNDHWEDMRREGFVSNRLFDAVASGARVVTDDVAGLDGLFGRSVQVATDAPALLRLVRHRSPDVVFGSMEDRRAAATRVHREHSFDARAQRLLARAVELRRSALRGGT